MRWIGGLSRAWGVPGHHSEPVGRSSSSRRHTRESHRKPWRSTNGGPFPDDRYATECSPISTRADVTVVVVALAPVDSHDTPGYQRARSGPEDLAMGASWGRPRLLPLRTWGASTSAEAPSTIPGASVKGQLELCRGSGDAGTSSITRNTTRNRALGGSRTRPPQGRPAAPGASTALEGCNLSLGAHPGTIFQSPGLTRGW
jgi:hypothetical protein